MLTNIRTLDYWDVQSNRPLAELYYKYLVNYFDPAGNNETSHFRFDNVEDEISNHATGGSTDQVSFRIGQYRANEEADDPIGQHLT
jgi:hypothetical protein